MSELPSHLRNKVARSLCGPLVADVHILMELPEDLQVGAQRLAVGASAGWAGGWVAGLRGVETRTHILTKLLPEGPGVGPPARPLRMEGC